MAFARFGHDSDVYVYEDSRGGFTYERCPDASQEFRCGTATEMIEHLLQHRSKGHKVPEDAITELKNKPTTS